VKATRSLARRLCSEVGGARLRHLPGARYQAPLRPTRAPCLRRPDLFVGRTLTAIHPPGSRVRTDSRMVSAFSAAGRAAAGDSRSRPQASRALALAARARPGSTSSSIRR
jgi:hypothetical protein